MGTERRGTAGVIWLQVIKGRTAKAPAAFRLDLMAVFSKPDLEEGAAVTSSSPGMPPVRGALRHTE